MAVHRGVKNQSADCLRHQELQIAVLNYNPPDVKVNVRLSEQRDDQYELACGAYEDVHIELDSLILPHFVAFESLLLPLGQLVLLLEETRVILVDEIDRLQRTTGRLLDFDGTRWL